MARWPAPARCKRRLAVALGPVGAASVQQRLLKHTLAVVDQACLQLGLARRLAIAGAGQRAAARAGLGPVVVQGRGGLGLLMQRQVLRAFRDGYGQVILIGSDLPQLAVADLQQAFAALDRSPLVLGPAADGGYWLLGLSQPTSRLFAGIDWGTDAVLRQTLAVASGLGLAVALLPQRHDLDRPGDLVRWR